MKILVATQKPFARVAVDGMREVVEQAGFEFALLEKYAGKQQLLDAVADADALIVRSDVVDDEVMAAAPQLKVVVRAGAGYDNVDLAAATSRGVCVENTPGQNSNAVAELVFGMTVMAMRNMFDGTSGRELKGKRLGLHAFGQVGRNVARIARGFGMEVSAFDPFCPSGVMEQAGVRAAATVEELYRGNDIVSIHIPATPATRGSIGENLIGLMPAGGVVVNTARKEVIDEAGLEAVLESRHDLKYFADVKPDCSESLVERFPGRVYFTVKKMGAQTSEANINAGIAAAKQCVAYLRDGDDRFRVNR